LPPRVLIIDDEEPIRLVVSSVLEYEGYAVDAAANGEALRLAAAHPPDLVLLDIMMPIMDGPEVRRRLRQDPRTADVPVVVMTAAGDATVWARRLDAAGALQKPFDLDNLLDLVQRLVGPPALSASEQ
jgi:CheY-like chemotaxis protein